ncbi:MAG TPA: FAD-dependent oxidoreductase [Mucilaginibacter sp.]|jgi:glycine/D-amino acid oxidase-like deaminating enzyme/nitrite reductase/ring-hydroxylating ferredoxin subunit
MKKKNSTIVRDGSLESAWQQSLASTVSLSAEKYFEKIYDTLIVGAGITGLTVALRLQAQGHKTILAEAYTIGFGTTGGTSAHINTFADTTFKEAESDFGEDGAKLFAEAIQEGYDIIKNNIEKFDITCDFEVKPGYLYAETKSELSQLDDIYEGAAKVGVAVCYADELPTPVPFKKALLFDRQAQFHPLKYLQGLQKAYLDAGGIILEHTKIETIEKEGNLLKAGDIKASHVIYATHMPPNINLFNFECAPYRSYVMAVKLKTDKYPDALIYDMQEPYHYLRSHTIDGEQLLIVGGLDHKTGHNDPEKAFANLERYVREYYSVSSVKYKWSSQYYVPVDGLPYIGQMPMAANGIYCATGFNGNGMMLGSVAAKIISDQILNINSPYTKLFSPSRIKILDSFSEFVKENADVAYHWVADRFGIHEFDSLKRLKPGTGKVVEVDGKKIAAYRDEDENIHALNPVCTHAACVVNWNSEERSWDCPCHGARFDIDGKVLTGPATKDLLPINL